MWLRYFTLADIILILLMGIVVIFLSIFLPQKIITAGDMVFIQSGQKLVGRYSLNQDRDVSVAGPLGETKVLIRAGKVSISGSPCPNQYCVKMGKLGDGGAALVCVPNEIVVRLGGKESSELDAISR